MKERLMKPKYIVVGGKGGAVYIAKRCDSIVTPSCPIEYHIETSIDDERTAKEIVSALNSVNV